MMTHTAYVIASYGVAGITVAVLILWVWADGRARQRELQALEAAGIRRRSAESGSAHSGSAHSGSAKGGEAQ